MEEMRVNKYIAVFVVGALVLAMIGVVARHEFQGGDQTIGSQWNSIPTLTSISLTFETHESPTPSHLSSVQPTLAFTSTPKQTNTPMPTKPDTPALSPTPTFLVMRVNAPFGVNLRDAPGENIIGGLPKDTIVQVYPGSDETNGIEWVHVVIVPDGDSGQLDEGWVALEHLILETEAPTLTP